MTDAFNKECEKFKKENKIEFEDAESGSEGSNDEDDDEDSPLFAKYNAIPTTPNHQVPPSPLERLGRTLSSISETFSSPEKLGNAFRYPTRARKQIHKK